ncbi:hypothetical protein A2853_00870 [Candidatus Kaiserbacteria bacterium RIFCSPHIGHO2_01_FULL_55_17]|uniref:30S ribosomal protein S21 n=1 Tax=Candidatus Kaiserbacteria bacterium RIFCSPHIGHO2_01_FULL_55_17 TaxID=1798484 RepID=A0A1F6D9K6_9BACT|nr:MAG: hypothetical protein A2853_00870 [Candidatus Kaiserbacteria bacterium RIFCSPHIGHO2_01_FULL_55_17]
MGINAEVIKSGNETALSIIRKFSRRVQGTGLVKTVRNRRYFARGTSKIVKKKRALKLLKRRAEYKQLLKEGKVTETPVRGRGGAMTRESSGRLGEGTPIAR